MAIEFVYSLPDVEKEFDELLESTSDFGRSKADFTKEEYEFRIRQLASCASQLMKGDDILKFAVEATGKYDFKGFDPRYESRFDSDYKFGMDRLLREILGYHHPKDDDFSRFVLLQALKQLNGIEPDNFEIITLKEKNIAADIFEYLKNDFDYIELPLKGADNMEFVLDAADMADFADEAYNDGKNNLAVFSRKSFEEYACNLIMNNVAQMINRNQFVGSRQIVEMKLLKGLLDTLPGVSIKHSETLAEKINGIVKDIAPVRINSFDVRETIANEFYSKWIDAYANGAYGSISDAREAKERMMDNIGAFVKYTGMMIDQRVMQGFYDRWLFDMKTSEAEEWIKFSGIKPGGAIMQRFYEKCFEKGWFDFIENWEKTSDEKPDYAAMSETIQESYKKWFRDGHFRYVGDGEKISRIKPDYASMADDVKNVMAGWFLEGDFINVEKGIEFSGMKPDYSSLDTQGAYFGWFSETDFERIAEGEKFSGIKADYQKMNGNGRIEDKYMDWFEKNWFKDIRDGAALSGIKFDASKQHDKIQDVYGKWFEEAKFSDIAKGEEFSSIKANYSKMEERVQASYRKWLARAWIEDIERGVALSKIMPDYPGMEKEAQAAYRECLENNMIAKAAKIKEMSGINPPKEMMSSQYKKWVKGGLFGYVKQGADFSGIAPDYRAMAGDIQKLYDGCMECGSFNTIDEGVSITGITPPKIKLQFSKVKDVLYRAVRVR